MNRKLLKRIWLDIKGRERGTWLDIVAKKTQTVFPLLSQHNNKHRRLLWPNIGGVGGGSSYFKQAISSATDTNWVSFNSILILFIWKQHQVPQVDCSIPRLSHTSDTSSKSGLWNFWLISIKSMVPRSPLWVWLIC